MQNSAGYSITSNPALLEVIPGAINQAPALTDLESEPLQFSHHAATVTATLRVGDPDNSNLTGATVAITANYLRLEDHLAFANTATISGRFDSTIGTLTLTGRDTFANYQSALRSVRYLNPRSIRDGRERTLSITATDGVSTSLPVTRKLKVAKAPDRSEIVAWGSNSAGQLDVPPGLSRAVAVAVGDNHTLALLSNGTVVAWGAAGSPEIQVPAGLSNVVSIAAGGAQSYALKADGKVVGWNTQSIPDDLSEVIAIGAGSDHGLALISDGTLRGWGGRLDTFCYYNGICECERCDNYDPGQTSPPGDSGYISVAGGLTHSIALKANGTVTGFGGYVVGVWVDDFDVFPIYGVSLPEGLSGVTEIAALGRASGFLLNNGIVIFSEVDAGPAGGLSNIVALSPLPRSPPRVTPCPGDQSGLHRRYPTSFRSPVPTMPWPLSSYRLQSSKLSPKLSPGARTPISSSL